MTGDLHAGVEALALMESIRVVEVLHDHFQDGDEYADNCKCGHFYGDAVVGVDLVAEHEADAVMALLGGAV